MRRRIKEPQIKLIDVFAVVMGFYIGVQLGELAKSFNVNLNQCVQYDSKKI